MTDTSTFNELDLELLEKNYQDFPKEDWSLVLDAIYIENNFPTIPLFKKAKMIKEWNENLADEKLKEIFDKVQTTIKQKTKN